MVARKTGAVEEVNWTAACFTGGESVTVLEAVVRGDTAVQLQSSACRL